MLVDFNKIVRGSIVDLPQISATPLPRSPFNMGQPQIMAAEIDDVLYLPSTFLPGQSLTLYKNHLFPKESYGSDYVFDMMCAELQAGRFNAGYKESLDPIEDDRLVCILGNVFSRAFGHWTEELLKVSVLERSGLRPAYVISDLPYFARDFLTFLGVEEGRILNILKPTIFSRALFTTMVNHENLFSYQYVLFELRAMVEELIGSPIAQPGKRYWLEREVDTSPNGGTTVNRSEVYQIVKSFGFEIIDIGALPITEQLKLIGKSEVIAGPHGSQFVHAQFMPRKSSVIECFSPIHVNPSILSIVRTLDINYNQVTSLSHVLWPYAHGRDCLVNIDHLEICLKSL